MAATQITDLPANHSATPAASDAWVPALPLVIVDDEETVLETLQRALRRQSFEIITFTRPVDALAHLERSEPSVVLSDFQMPELDGLAFLARVRDRWPDAQRLLLSARTDKAALERGINDAAVHRVMSKPWRNESLIQVLEDAQHQNRVRREHAVLVERLRHRNEELRYLNRLMSERVEQSDAAMVSFRRRWDVALDAISDPLVIVGADLRIEGCNTAAAELARRPREQMEGQKCHLALFGRSTACADCVQRTGRARLRVSTGGEARTFDARGYPLPGGRRSSLCVYRDVTRTVADENEQVWREKMLAIGKLAANVGHELNNPLHLIVSFAQLAQYPALPQDKLARYHEIIHQSALRCGEIARSLRDLSRDDVSGEATAVDVHAAAAKALRLFDGQRKRIALSAPPAEAALTLANAPRLHQVVVHLVQNALEVTPDGGTVAVSVEATDEEVRLIVDDEGAGLADEDQDRVFEPFFRAPVEGEGLGFGLGLAVSRRIVQECGGSLSAKRRPQGGTRFEATLPRTTEPATKPRPLTSSALLAH